MKEIFFNLKTIMKRLNMNIKATLEYNKNELTLQRIEYEEKIT